MQNYELLSISAGQFPEEWDTKNNVIDDNDFYSDDKKEKEKEIYNIDKEYEKHKNCVQSFIKQSTGKKLNYYFSQGKN